MARRVIPKVDWSAVIPAAAGIARSYSTRVTLRQLHYRLVATGVGGYLNIQAHYKNLSSRTAALRREGTFPALSDMTRSVHALLTFDDPSEAVEYARRIYRRDRTENQKYQQWVLYEKATLGAQIEAWTDPYGIPSAALRGYSSESLEADAFSRMSDDGRPVVVWYIGDLDPEGEDIDRNFRDQAEAQGIEFEHWERLTVLPEHIAALGLVPNIGKPSSSRAKGFIAKHGSLFQVETEAVDPALLEWAVAVAITRPDFFDADVYKASMTQEQTDDRMMSAIAHDMDAIVEGFEELLDEAKEHAESEGADDDDAEAFANWFLVNGDRDDLAGDWTYWRHAREEDEGARRRPRRPRR